MTLLSSSDCERIEEAIRRVEKRSAAEFVVAVVGKSGTYSRGRAFVAAAWAIAAALVYFRYVPWGAEYIGLVVQLPVGLLVWLLLGYAPLHRLFIPPKEAERLVHGAAFRIFAERGVYRTRDRTGMLLLISELERRAVLLGDEAIHERVGDAGWRTLVEHLLKRIREGQAATGVIEVIERLEGDLAREIPVKPGDENELPDRVIREP